MWGPGLLRGAKPSAVGARLEGKATDMDETSRPAFNVHRFCGVSHEQPELPSPQTIRPFASSMASSPRPCWGVHPLPFGVLETSVATPSRSPARPHPLQKTSLQITSLKTTPGFQKSNPQAPLAIQEERQYTNQAALGLQSSLIF